MQEPHHHMLLPAALSQLSLSPQWAQVMPGSTEVLWRTLNKCYCRIFNHPDYIPDVQPNLKHWNIVNINNNPFNEPGEPVPEKNICSLTPFLRGYYTTALINFLHFQQSIASFLHICRVWQSFFFYNLTPSFLWPASRSYTIHFKIHAFSHPTILVLS